jgi:hypothetical protein
MPPEEVLPVVHSKRMVIYFILTNNIEIGDKIFSKKNQISVLLEARNKDNAALWQVRKWP